MSLHHRRVVLSLVLFILLAIGYIYRVYDTLYTADIVFEQAPFAGRIPPEISRGDTTKKQVIFTFDGGEGNQSTEPILAALNKHQVKGTFFLTGKWVQKNPDLVRAIAAQGHEIFNHTYDHPHLSDLNMYRIKHQLRSMDKTLSSLIGSSTQPYFRPPYGDRNAATLAAAAHAGYQSVYWTVDALDWLENQGETNESVSMRILENVAPGTIYLMHVGDTITGAILDDVLTQIVARGYRAVSLTEGL